MSFPASGFETVYRNKRSEVARFMDSKHPNHYRIYNLSNREYDYNDFKGSYRFYTWEDHHSPPIDMLFRICEDMLSYLEGKSKSNTYS